MKHFYLGALNKDTNLYEYPSIALKSNKYFCPECKNDVIIKKGNINIHHFCHKKSDNPCVHYSKPSSSIIHSIAQNLIINLLNDGKELSFLQKCHYCNDNNKIKIKINDNQKVIKEYRIDGGKYICDIAIVDNDDVIFIIEIYNTHKTKEENRFGSWVELDANKILENINNNIFIFDCMRNIICNNKKCQNKILEYNLDIETPLRRQILYEENKEYNIFRKEHIKLIEIYNDTDCKCRIKHRYICKCKEPNYVMHRISPNYICKKCNLWKCRC